GVPERGDQECNQQDRVPRLRDGRAHDCVVGTDQPDHQTDHIEGQGHQRDRGDALVDEVAGTVLGRAKPAGALERRAEVVVDLHAPPHCVIATTHTSAVSTRLPNTDIQLLRTKLSIAKPSPASCSRWRIPLTRWKASDQLQPNRIRKPRGERAKPLKSDHCPGPAASDISPQASSRLPSTRTIPVPRCRIEVTICTCQL